MEVARDMAVSWVATVVLENGADSIGVDRIGVQRKQRSDGQQNGQKRSVYFAISRGMTSCQG